MLFLQHLRQLNDIYKPLALGEANQSQVIL